MPYLTEPEVWRAIEVPSLFNFEQLHWTIQIAFGWENDHLWNFHPMPKGRASSPDFVIETPDPYGGHSGSKTLNPAKVTVGKMFAQCKELIYLYDFGDSWTHIITVEGVSMDNLKHAVCTGGRGTCPPEDCGGFSGYEALKEAFATKDKDEMDNYREWLGMRKNGVWNPDAFTEKSLAEVNQRLKNI